MLEDALKNDVEVHSEQPSTEKIIGAGITSE
jgi:hypothetical protein